MSAKTKGSPSRSGFSTARRLFSLIAALLLLAGSVLVMYPNILHGKVAEESAASDGSFDPLRLVESAREKFEQAIAKLYSDENVQIEEDRLGLENFPLYGSEYFYGVKDVLEDEALHAYIRGDSEEKPDLGSLIKNIYTNPKIASDSGEARRIFMQRIYDLVLISLISIPIYMLLRALIYNALYGWISDGIFLTALPLRGIATVSCGVTGTCLSWMLYNTVLFDKLLSKVMNWFSGLSASKAAETVSRLPSALAVNATNIIAIVVLVALILALVRLTVFRGSVVMSVFLGLFRTLLFVISFAFINAFIGDWTWRVVLFGALFVIAAGLIERIFDR